MAEARLNREYMISRLGVGALMFGICAWSLYDGMKGWPQKNADMDRARPLLLATNLTATVWIDRDDDGVSELDRLFSATGGKPPAKLVRKLSEYKLPEAKAYDTDSLESHQAQLQNLFEMPLYSQHDLQTQWWQAGITTFFGLLLVLVVGLKVRRRFVADDRGLSGNGFGPRPRAYEDISAINWAKWDEKGIIVLTFRPGKTVKLDGWHFSGMIGIADEICKHRPDLAPKASSVLT